MYTDKRVLLIAGGGTLGTYTGKELLLPESVRLYHAGIDWAGNSGKLIANLLFKPDALRQAVTIYSGACNFEQRKERLRL